jgi:hypothetical protein
MKAMNRSLILFLTAATAAAAAVAAPTALAGIEGGLWEVSGMTGAKAPVQQCVADPVKLAALDHPGARCTETVLDHSATGARVSMQCAGGGFGQATIKVVTPRNLKIEVQGIADGAPYSHTLQARRIGPCPAGGGKPERGSH